MPLYEYECEVCGKRFEEIRKFSDVPLETCTHCGSGPIHRLLSSPAIQFKGSGWYVTDYAKKGKTEPTASSDKSGQSGETDTKSASSESKSEKPSEKKSPSSETSTSAAPTPSTGTKN